MEKGKLHQAKEPKGSAMLYRVNNLEDAGTPTEWMRDIPNKYNLTVRDLSRVHIADKGGLKQLPGAYHYPEDCMWSITRQMGNPGHNRIVILSTLTILDNDARNNPQFKPHRLFGKGNSSARCFCMDCDMKMPVCEYEFKRFYSFDNGSPDCLEVAAHVTTLSLINDLLDAGLVEIHKPNGKIVNGGGER